MIPMPPDFGFLRKQIWIITAINMKDYNHRVVLCYNNCRAYTSDKRDTYQTIL